MRKKTLISTGNEDNLESDQILDKNTLVSTNNIKYIIKKTVGRGTFGLVYLGTEPISNKNFAIKRYFKNLHPNICQLEISILSYLNEKTDDENIVRIYDGLYLDQDIYLVTNYFEHENFIDYYQELEPKMIKVYMKQLLKSLKTIHEYGIIHRDIKPNNFLFNPKTGKALLIDFGLAEADIDSRKWVEINKDNKNNDDFKIITELQKVNYRHRTGTKGFLAPEIIFRSSYQSTAVDIWAAGVIFLCFIAKRLPIFNLNKFSKINDETIKDIEPLILLYGIDEINECAKQYQAFLYIGNHINEYKMTNGFNDFVSRNDLGDDALDLCKKMMELYPEKRITAEQALKHKYFNDEN